MSNIDKKEIFVTLLEEGSPTLRRTSAMELEEGLYKLLPSENYDPEDEVWEFEPGAIVFGQLRKNDTNEEMLVATRIPESRESILLATPGKKIVPMIVQAFVNNKFIRKRTEAVDLGNGLYKLLPTEDYTPQSEQWEFAPGSVIRAVEEKKERELIAFDQIREDRMNEFYARQFQKKS